MINLRRRKLLHYTLITIILLIQVFIVAFFYNEFLRKKRLQAMEKQLAEIQLVERITGSSKKSLKNAQEHLNQYLLKDDRKNLNLYFKSLDSVRLYLDSVHYYRDHSHILSKKMVVPKKNIEKLSQLKTLTDSVRTESGAPPELPKSIIPTFSKFETKYDAGQYEMQVQKFSDSTKKKGLFSRLGDAIAGKEIVRKDSIVITLKNGKTFPFSKVKKEMDSIIAAMNQHYINEMQQSISRIQKTVTVERTIEKNSGNSNNFMFAELMDYSSQVISVYDAAVNKARISLEKDYNTLNSKIVRQRNYFVLGTLMFLFLASLLLLYLTRLTFSYEKRLAEAYQKISENLTFQSKILGMLSHEIRAPLKIMGTLINRIRKKTSDVEIKENLKSISFTNSSLLLQANNILEYAKNQHTGNKLVESYFILVEYLDTLLKSVEPYLETKNNTLKVVKTIDPQLQVFADSSKITQIYTNIINNANKFTENGIITVTAQVEQHDKDTVAFNTTIKDTGIGISAENLKNIFEPYYQASNVNNGPNSGAGLGLNFCRELVEMLGGHISAKGELQQGMSVSFVLYLKTKS